MQTFITDTFPNRWGVENLDQKRLVKQLLECRQIMAALAGETKGWVNHPATKMWRGKESVLNNYVWHIVAEMKVRGYKYRTNLDVFTALYSKVVDNVGYNNTLNYFSLEDLDKIIYTHRGRLFIKDPEYYAQWSHYSDFKKNVCCDHCNYYWPTHFDKLSEVV